MLCDILQTCNSFEAGFYCLFICLRMNVRGVNESNQKSLLFFKDFLSVLREASKECLLFDLFQCDEMFKQPLFKDEKQFLQTFHKFGKDRLQLNVEKIAEILAKYGDDDPAQQKEKPEDNKSNNSSQ